MPYAAAVIGLGKIGLGYDYYHNNNYILTHANGFYLHPGFQLIGAVDSDEEKCQLFTKKYRLPAFTNIELLKEHVKIPAVFSIAVPTEEHYSTIESILKFNPLAIICEKPFTSKSELAAKIIIKAKQQHCALLVNYIRRFDPGVLALKKKLEEGRIGNIYKINIIYSRGLLNNGSHFIDLLRFLFGEIIHFKIIHQKKDEPDNLDIYLQIKNIDCYLLGTNNITSLHEMMILGSEGVVRYTNSGNSIQIQHLQRDKIFSDFTTLSDQFDTVPNEMNRYQWYTCEHLYQYLNGKSHLNSDGESACETLKIIESLIEGDKNE